VRHARPATGGRGSDPVKLRAALLAWYDANRRDFPWRRTRDPYAVLVSEVMLQQTQASRVNVAFPAFMRRFPTAADLAAASSRDVLVAWSGLGYNRRALALQRAAAAVTRSGWPRDVAGLQALPGIGPYTARAVASLAFHHAVGVVDTNVRRWLTRRFGLRPDAAASDLQALADALAGAGTDGRTDAWTHASMEFGANVCRARTPRCAACPVAGGCPSRTDPVAVPVPRQAPFSGSNRAGRGALLRALVAAPGHALALDRVGTLVPAARAARILAELEREGFIRREGDEVRLGGPSRGDATATIDP